MIEAKVVFDGGKILVNEYTIATVGGYWTAIEVDESFDCLESAVTWCLEN